MFLCLFSAGFNGTTLTKHCKESIVSKTQFRSRDQVAWNVGSYNRSGVVIAFGLQYEFKNCNVNSMLCL